MDSLITFLVLLIISAIGTWLKRLAQKKAEDSSKDSQNAPPVQSGQPRPTAAPPPQRKVISWEEELRRLLGEEEATPPPRPQPAKPPPTIAPPRPVAPPPIPVLTTPAKPPPVVVRAPVPEVVPLPVPTVERVSTGDLARLEESRKAYERASQLDKLAAERIKKVPGQVVGSTSVVFKKTASPEVMNALSLVKNSRAAREAIIVSVILGPPKALESGFPA